MGCKRTARLSLGFQFRNEHHERCVAKPPSNHTARPAVVRNDRFTSADEFKLLEILRLLWKVRPDRLFLRDLIRSERPECGNETIEHFVKQIIREFAQDDTDPAQFLEYISQHGRLKTNFQVTRNSRGEECRRLSAVAWRDRDWPRPQEFTMFFIDGAGRFLCRGYTVIPVLGLPQDLGPAKLVAVLLAGFEATTDVQLLLDLLIAEDSSFATRTTRWMSDDSGGIVGAISSRLPKAVHALCRLHKAANFCANYAARGEASIDDDEDMGSVLEELKARVDEAKKMLEEHDLMRGSNLDPEPYVLKTFSANDDRYRCPLETANQKEAQAGWFNYIRTAPSLEHLLERLGSFAGNSLKRWKYVVYLWGSKSRWACCCMTPHPDFGFATNNISESFIKHLRRRMPENLDLSAFAKTLRSIMRVANPFSQVTSSLLKDPGKQFKKLETLRRDVQPSFADLVRHMNKTGVSRFGQLLILSNARYARPFKAVRRSVDREQLLTEEEARAVALDSAFGSRFLKFVYGTQARKWIRSFIKVKKKKKTKDGELVSVMHFVAISKDGSYLCSCGFPADNGGALCPHLLCCFEKGLLTFHARYNLHPFLLEPVSGKADFSVSERKPSGPKINACRHVEFKEGTPIVTSRAEWSPLCEFKDAAEGDVTIQFLMRLNDSLTSEDDVVQEDGDPAPEVDAESTRSDDGRPHEESDEGSGGSKIEENADESDSGGSTDDSKGDESANEPESDGGADKSKGEESANESESDGGADEPKSEDSANEYESAESEDESESEAEERSGADEANEDNGASDEDQRFEQVDAGKSRKDERQRSVVSHKRSKSDLENEAKPVKRQRLTESDDERETDEHDQRPRSMCEIGYEQSAADTCVVRGLDDEDLLINPLQPLQSLRNLLKEKNADRSFLTLLGPRLKRFMGVSNRRKHTADYLSELLSTLHGASRDHMRRLRDDVLQPVLAAYVAANGPPVRPASGAASLPKKRYRTRQLYKSSPVERISKAFKKLSARNKRTSVGDDMPQAPGSSPQRVPEERDDVGTVRSVYTAFRTA